MKKILALCADEPLGTIGVLLLLALVICAVGAPLFAGKDPLSTSMIRVFKAPSGEYWFGTDQLGRDVFSRFIYGSRTSLLVGLGAVTLASVVGGLLGIFSGLIGGRVDNYLQRFMDALMAMPPIVLAILIMAVLGTSITNTIVAIAVAYFPRINRLTRSTAVVLRESLFVESAKVAGASKLRISLYHIMPNCVGPWLVYASALLGTAFLAEATLSFLGLGVPPPTPSWGRDLSENMSRFEFAPWLCIFPGLGISFAVFAANFLGDSLRNILDPRLKS
ncbi:MAG TPA: ABC transporter permease [Syntrophorhabdaceae bacterium]|nr:ABC transporter permease [Syntrophorhabdaceae bacterium]